VIKAIEVYLGHLRDYQVAFQQWQERRTGPQPSRPPAPHILLTGPGGTGKSFVIEAISRLMKRWLGPEVSHSGVLLCAPTGVAAFNIGGVTLHSAFRIRVEKDGQAEGSQYLSQRQLDLLQEQWSRIEIVIVDEVSMMKPQHLYWMNKVLNKVFAEGTTDFAIKYDLYEFAEPRWTCRRR
jgi:hypothetical protein